MPRTGAAPLAPSPAGREQVCEGPGRSWPPSLHRGSPHAHWPRRGDHPGGVPKGPPRPHRGPGRAGGGGPAPGGSAPDGAWLLATASPPAPGGRGLGDFPSRAGRGPGRRERSIAPWSRGFPLLDEGAQAGCRGTESAFEGSGSPLARRFPGSCPQPEIKLGPGLQNSSVLETWVRSRL